MEKEKLFMTSPAAALWNSGMDNCFLNPNWDYSMDQSDPFESASASNNVSAISSSTVGNDTFMIRELIGRLGNICNSGEISPHSYINSTNNSCYSTPLNSPPKLNLSMMDSQIRGDNPPSLAPFPTDPGFAERAARFSCFGSISGSGSAAQFGSTESELSHSHRLMPRGVVEAVKMSRVSSNHSIRTVNNNTGQESNQGPNSDKKFCGPSTPENAEGGESREESSVSEQISGGEKSNLQNEGNARKRKSIPRGKSKETPSSSPCVSDVKTSGASDPQPNSKKSKSSSEEEQNKHKSRDNSSKPPPEAPKDYIHVRARRGQATDSHSLAERVRREKISERMKFLQDLVPGCNKVTGKAVMLDEIINYVQSLQRQVEFLSMKLATVNPRIDFNMEALLPKDMFQSRGSMNQTQFPLNSSMVPPPPLGYESQQGMGLGFQNGMDAPIPLAAAAQVPTFWNDDLQSVVQMGFGQNQQLDSLHGSNPTAHQMKVEL